MKRLLIILCVFLLTASTMATEGNIKFLKICDGYENDRYLPLQPYAIHDASTSISIHLYSDFPIKTMQHCQRWHRQYFVLGDYYSQIRTILYFFNRGDAEKGVYILDLNDGRNKYQGYFEIDS